MSGMLSCVKALRLASAIVIKVRVVSPGIAKAISCKSESHVNFKLTSCRPVLGKKECSAHLSKDVQNGGPRGAP